MAATGDSFGLFWNSINKDRTYNADSFERWAKTFFTNGVFNGHLQVLSQSGMNVTVKTGYAHVEGKPNLFEGDATFTIAPANSRYPRIDTIVVRRDNENRSITREYVQGAYSGDTPQPTAPTRNGIIYELVLAQITVAAGATEISQANIKDTRMDSNLCGWVAGTTTEITFDQIKAQFDQFLLESQTEFDQYQAESKAAFEQWFADLQDELSGDVAANLQTQINTLKSDVGSMNEDVININEKIDKLPGLKTRRITINNISINASSNKQDRYTFSDSDIPLGYQAIGIVGYSIWNPSDAFGLLQVIPTYMWCTSELVGYRLQNLSNAAITLNMYVYVMIQPI